MAPGLIAPGPIGQVERRRAPRVRPDDTPWGEAALLRPGQDVTVLNLSRGGALVESASRLLPGVRAELLLIGTRRCMARGRIDRSQVTGLTPLRYRGAIVFDDAIDLR